MNFGFVFGMLQVLVEYRGKDPDYVEWAKALKELYLPGLRDYVKQFHTRGPAWNPIGVEFSQWRPGTAEAAKKPSAPPPPPKGPPPPPPPSFAPPAPAMPSSKPSSSAGAPLSMSAVFQDINKGESVTAGHCPIHFLEMFSHIVDVGADLPFLLKAKCGMLSNDFVAVQVSKRSQLT
jgi:hypothetical protein